MGMRDDGMARGAVATAALAAAILIGAAFASSLASGAPGAGPSPIASPSQELEIPPVQPRQVPPPASRPELRLPQRPPGNGNTLEIPLPKVFRGCWRGVVAHIDSLKRLGGPVISGWVTKTYRICYVQSAGGSFRPTFSEAGMLGHTSGISNAAGRLKVTWTDGRTRATMRAFLHFDEAPTSVFGLAGRTGSVDEMTNMECRIEGGVMHVEGRVYTQWNDEPWALIAWQADFDNAPE
jgi:hypothetical protein